MPRSRQLNEEMRERSRTQILAAARRRFAADGYFSCKVADIAREAEMSTGNVYWYFDSKEDILKAVLRAGFEAQASVLEAAAEHPGSSREKLRHLVRAYLAMSREQHDFTNIFISLLGHSGMSFFQRLGFDMTGIGARYHATLAALFQEGQAEGVVLDAPPELLVIFFFSFFNGLMITYGEDWLTYEPERFERAVLRLICGSKTTQEVADVD